MLAPQPRFALLDFPEHFADTLPHRLVQRAVGHHDVEKLNAAAIRDRGEGIHLQVRQRLHVRIVGMLTGPDHQADFRHVPAHLRDQARAHAGFQKAVLNIGIEIEVIGHRARLQRLARHSEVVVHQPVLDTRGCRRVRRLHRIADVLDEGIVRINPELDIIPVELRIPVLRRQF